VGHEKFSFERIEPLEDRIQRLSKDAAYVQVWDRTDRKNEQNLGRFDLTESDALPYLTERIQPALLPMDDEEPADPYEGSFGEYDDLEEDEPEPQRAASEPPSLLEIAQAACRWLREIAISNTVGEDWCRYRVKVFGPKGMKVLHTGTFICRNHDHDLELPVPSETRDLRIPSPTFEQAANSGAAKGIKALGDYYAQWGRIVLGSVGQLQGVNNEMLGRLHKQLTESRGQVDQLVASILENRFNELQMTEERQASERSDDARHALAKEALSQLGDAAKAFLTARGINPEMADVLGVLGSSPELMGALNDPEVRALMQDPSNLSGLAQMLKAAAAQARAAREAAPPPPPASEAHQPSAG
jgi:hypothetical protein